MARNFGSAKFRWENFAYVGRWGRRREFKLCSGGQGLPRTMVPGSELPTLLEPGSGIRVASFQCRMFLKDTKEYLRYQETLRRLALVLS
jgi:hypothetical protein